MIQYERPQMGLKEERELEGLRAEKERMDAVIEYVAMMADVELPEDEEAQEHE